MTQVAMATKFEIKTGYNSDGKRDVYEILAPNTGFLGSGS